VMLDRTEYAMTGACRRVLACPLLNQ